MGRQNDFKVLFLTCSRCQVQAGRLSYYFISSAVKHVGMRKLCHKVNVVFQKNSYMNRVHIYSYLHTCICRYQQHWEIQLCVEERLPEVQGKSAHCVCVCVGDGVCCSQFNLMLSGLQLQRAMRGAYILDGVMA